MNLSPASALPGRRPGISVWDPPAGQGFFLWGLVAALNFVSQIFLRHELAPGEFGSANAALGVAGLMVMPLLGFRLGTAFYLNQAPAPERAEFIARLRSGFPVLMETAALVWGAFAIVLLFVLLPWLQLPRISLNVFTFLLVLTGLAALLGSVICQDRHHLLLWFFLVGGAAFVRATASGILAWAEPWAESALGAVVMAGLITLIPLLWSRPETTDRWRVLAALKDPDFLLSLAATITVVVALFLFSSADRIVAQAWFGLPENNDIHYVDRSAFDNYQAAGLLARGLLWGTQPLLWMLFARRFSVNRTTSAVLKYLWFYLGALVGGGILLILLGPVLSWIFCRDFRPAARLLPAFTLAMVFLGFVHSLGLFALASRRYPECFTLGACSLAYTAVLMAAGRQPSLMISYMFGGALITAMVVLFVGVVRWGRKQP